MTWLHRLRERVLEVSGSRLNRRLMVWFVLLSIGPLLFTNTIGYRRSREIISRQVESDLTALAHVQAQHIGHRLEGGALALKAITAGNYFLAAGANRRVNLPAGEMGTVADSATMYWYLEEKLHELDAFEALALFSSEGRLVASAGSYQIPSHRPPEEGASRWSHQPTQSPDDPPKLTFYAWVTDEEGTRVAYLAGTVKGPHPADFLQIPTTLGSRARVTILDAGMRPLFVSVPWFGLNFSRAVRAPPALGPPGFYSNYRGVGGVEFLGVSVRIPATNWRLLVEIPMAEGLGALRNLRTLSLALEGLFIFLLVLTASLVAHDIVSPIRRLVHATRRIGAGDLSARVDPGRRDEVGELGHSFNEMAGTLAASDAKLRELHQREIVRASQLATVGQLASGVAHEIKNPVAAIASGLDLVHRHLQGDPGLEDVVEEMRQQTRRIGLTIQELLQFARPTTPSLAPIPGNRVIDHAVRLVRPTAQQHGLTVELDLTGGAPILQADEGMLQQALVNLLMNAIAATASGGSLTVRSAVEVDHFVVTVQDTGHGIPANQLEDVFKPFYTTRHRGTGLGLPITRTIVEHHHGQLTIASEEGRGTIVSLRLPLYHGQEPPA